MEHLQPLSVLDLFPLDPKWLDEQRNKSKTGLGGVLGICTGFLVLLYLIFLIIVNEGRPDVVETSVIDLSFTKPSEYIVEWNSDVVDVSSVQTLNLTDFGYGEDEGACKDALQDMEMTAKKAYACPSAPLGYSFQLQTPSSVSTTVGARSAVGSSPFLLPLGTSRLVIHGPSYFDSQFDVVDVITGNTTALSAAPEPTAFQTFYEDHGSRSSAISPLGSGILFAGNDETVPGADDGPFYDIPFWIKYMDEHGTVTDITSKFPLSDDDDGIRACSMPGRLESAALVSCFAPNPWHVSIDSNGEIQVKEIVDVESDDFYHDQIGAIDSDSMLVGPEGNYFIDRGYGVFAVFDDGYGTYDDDPWTFSFDELRPSNNGSIIGITNSVSCSGFAVVDPEALGDVLSIGDPYVASEKPATDFLCSMTHATFDLETHDLVITSSHVRPVIRTHHDGAWSPLGAADWQVSSTTVEDSMAAFLPGHGVFVMDFSGAIYNARTSADGPINPARTRMTWTASDPSAVVANLWLNTADAGTPVEITVADVLPRESRTGFIGPNGIQVAVTSVDDYKTASEYGDLQWGYSAPLPLVYTSEATRTCSQTEFTWTVSGNTKTCCAASSAQCSSEEVSDTSKDIPLVTHQGPVRLRDGTVVASSASTLGMFTFQPRATGQVRTIRSGKESFLGIIGQVGGVIGIIMSAFLFLKQKVTVLEDENKQPKEFLDKNPLYANDSA